MAMYNFLIVDDDKDDQEFISAAILNVHAEARISFFSDGAEMPIPWLNKLECPDVILLDVNMPIIGGKTVLKNIRNDSSLKDIPVIMLTTDNGTFTRSQYLELGANEFYTKPYEFSQMVNIISRISDKWLRKVNDGIESQRV